MKSFTKKISLAIIIIVVIIIGLLIILIQKGILSFNQNPIPGKINKVEFVLVRNAFYNEVDIYKPNAALLITDTEEINLDQKLFLADHEIQHYCGYHYEIQFWYNRDSLLNSKFVNIECESFEYKTFQAWSLVEKYSHLLKKHPTHFIYELKLSVLTDPSFLLNVLRNNDLFVLKTEDEWNRYPSIEFSVTRKYSISEKLSEKDLDDVKKINENQIKIKINQITNQIKLTRNILKESTIEFQSLSSSNKEIVNVGFITLTLDHNQNLDNLKSILNKSEATINYVDIPQYYCAQILDTTSNINVLRMKLRKYKEILSVSEYDNSPLETDEIDSIIKNTYR